MKRLFILYVILFSLLAQAGGVCLLALHYSLNKASITERFCQNKQRPELACEGSCHLKKQVRQLEGSSAEKEKQLKIQTETVWVYQQISAVLLHRPFCTDRQDFSWPQHWHSHRTGYDFFHPPRMNA